MHNLLHYKIYPAVNEMKQQPVLFILHGLLGSMDNWRSQAKRLSQYRTIITVDLRNHGRSPHLRGMSYREMALDIVTIIKHEKLISVDVLGHSMGGKVAMWLALHSPNYIKKLIVVDIAPKTYPLWHQQTLIAMLKVPLQTCVSRQQVNLYLTPFIKDDIERLFLLKNIQKCKGRGYQWRCNLKEIVKSYLKIASFPVSHHIFSKPCYFLRGEKSLYIHDDDHFLIKNLFTQAEIHTIKNAAHLPHIEQADFFYQKMKSFLK